MKYKTLVLSGGGTRGIIHLGAINYIEQNNLANFDTYIGTSAGAIIIVLLAIGYTSIEIFQFLLHFQFDKFVNILNPDILDEQFFNLINSFGLDDGSKSIFIIKKMIEKKTKNADITFKQVYEIYNKSIIICATCLNQLKAEYFNYIDNPDMPIYLACRLSMSIPYIYTSVMYNDLLYADGGIIDNYPFSKTSNVDETIGIYLDDNSCFENIDNLKTFTHALFTSLLQNAHSNTTKYIENTIYINTNGCGSVDFNMTDEIKQNFFNLGYESAKKYMDNKNINIDNIDNIDINKNIDNKDIDNKDKDIDNIEYYI
jgi:NTE family protein